MQLAHSITLGACLAIAGGASAQELTQRPEAGFSADTRGGLIGIGLEMLAWDTSTHGDDALVEVYTAPVGSFPLTGDVPQVFTGLEIEFAQGVLYVADRSGDVMHRLSPIDGAYLSSIPITYPPEGNVITAMEYIEGVMYVCLGTASNNSADTYFATVDLVTGDIIVIGDTGVGRPIVGLAYPGQGVFVYGVSGGGNAPTLYTITATAITSAVGPVVEGASPAPNMTGLEFGADGRLYALPNRLTAQAGDLYVVNPENAQALNMGPTGTPGLVALTSRQGCSDADLAPTFGAVDFDDVLEFLTRFGMGCQ